MNKRFFKKKVLLATWGCNEEDHYTNRDWKPILEKLFGHIHVFSPRDNYFRYGKEEMNRRFLNLIAEEKPDYVLFGISYDEFYPETLIKVKQASPKTITINLFGDDNWRFDNWSRYWALFFDYIWASEKDISNYIAEGIDHVVFLHGTNPDFFKKIGLKKIYDVSFIGMPIRDRPEYIKYLYNHGISMRLFGAGWEKYSNLRDIYGGFLKSKDYVKTINETKINLSFSKGALASKKDKQLKGRVFDIFSCRGFLLMEDYPGLKQFYPLPEIKKIIFKNKQELLRKIQYYLQNGEEREALAEKFHKFTLKNYSWESEFTNFFNNTLNMRHQRAAFLEINKNIVRISLSEFENLVALKKKLICADYVSLSSENAKNLDYRDYFQAYSLEKSKKPVSCCDYYLHDCALGDYMLFNAKKALQSLNKKQFNRLCIPESLLIQKNYFIKNMRKFRKFFEGKSDNLLNEKNTSIVSIPLLRNIKNNKFGELNYSEIKSTFKMLFIEKLYSLIYQKKIDSYLIKLIGFSLLKNKFILQYLLSSLFSSERWQRAKQ